MSDHNPAQLTPEQVGAPEWRLLDEDEIAHLGTVPLIEGIQLWTNSRWNSGWRGVNKVRTYRTKLDRAELRQARGLEPEPAKDGVAEGMFFSDRCHFCTEYGDKSKPHICVNCAKAIDAIVTDATAEKDAEISELDRHSREADHIIHQREVERDDLYAQLERKDAEIAGLKTECANWKQWQEDTRIGGQNIAKERDNLAAEVARLRDADWRRKIPVLLREWDELRVQLATVTAQSRAKDGWLADLRTRAESAEKERDETKERLKQVEQERDSWRETAGLDVGRLQRELDAANRKLAVLPGDWMTDSSLETWFPLTARELAELKQALLESEESARHAYFAGWNCGLGCQHTPATGWSEYREDRKGTLAPSEALRAHDLELAERAFREGWMSRHSEPYDSAGGAWDESETIKALTTKGAQS